MSKKFLNSEFWMEGIRFLISDSFLGATIFSMALYSIIYYLLGFGSTAFVTAILGFVFLWLGGSMYACAQKEENDDMRRFLAYWAGTKGALLAFIAVFASTVLRSIISGYYRRPLNKWFWVAVFVWLFRTVRDYQKNKKAQGDQ